MKMILMLCVMLFLHCYGDFHYQGILAQMKERKWWEKKYPGINKTKYKHDYKLALWVHGFEQSFIIMLPMIISLGIKWYALYVPKAIAGTMIYVVALILNTFFHVTIDDMKANDLMINLWNDQFFHVLHLIFTWLVWSLTIGW